MTTPLIFSRNHLPLIQLSLKIKVVVRILNKVCLQEYIYLLQLSDTQFPYREYWIFPRDSLSVRRSFLSNFFFLLLTSIIDEGRTAKKKAFKGKKGKEK